MKKSIAWAGTIFMFTCSLASLILSIGSEKTIWFSISIFMTILYTIALEILIVDYFQTRGNK